MGSNMTIYFVLNEEFHVTSSQNSSSEIFKSNKSLQMTLDANKTSLECFIDAVDEWINRVELNRHLYHLERIEPDTDTLGGVVIKYENKELAKIKLIESIIKQPNRKIKLQWRYQLMSYNDIDRLFDTVPTKTHYVDAKRFNPCTSVNGEAQTLLHLLEQIVPTRSKAIIDGITYLLHINPSDIILDSFHKRYVIKCPFIFKGWVIPCHPKKVYRYVSMSVFFNMLNNHSFRMNSIICQSDDSESLYLGNLLCQEYEDKIDRLKEYANEENCLISCFTSGPDDAKMWEEYGDRGSGVMLGFEPIGEILTPIQYVDENSDKICEIKNIVNNLKNAGIGLYFDEINDIRRFVKNNRYKDEREWRLVHRYKGQLDYATYTSNGKTTIAPYHDFTFNGNLLETLNLKLVSIKFGPKQRESNMAYLLYQCKNVFGNIDILLTK